MLFLAVAGFDYALRHVSLPYLMGSSKVMGAVAFGLSQMMMLQVTTCSICLEDFGKGQRVRELPKCGHVYHAHCVDRWLRMHNACPLCRVPAL